MNYATLMNVGLWILIGIVFAFLWRKLALQKKADKEAKVEAEITTSKDAEEIKPE